MIVSKKIFITFIKLVIISATCLFLLLNLNFTELYENIESISWPFFALVVFISFLDQVIIGLKWNILLAAFNVHVPWSAPVIAYLRGKFFKLTMPSTIGIDAYKIYYLHKYHSSPPTKVATTVVIERFFGAISSLLVISLLLYFSLPEFLPNLSQYILYMSVGGTVAILLCVYSIIYFAQYLKPLTLPSWLPKFVIKGVNGITGNLQVIQKQSTKIWSFFIFSSLEKLSYGSAIYVAAIALGHQDIGFLYIIAATPLMALLERLPISISSIGLREGFIVLLLSPFDLSVTQAMSIALLIRFAEIIQLILLSGVWFTKKEFKDALVSLSDK